MSPVEFKKLCDAVEGYTALGLVEEAFEILESLTSELMETKNAR